MSNTREIERAVGRYLEEMARELVGMDAAARDDILRDVESHIYAALEKHGGNPTIKDLKVVLAGMEPPSAYAREAGAPSPRTAAAETKPTISRCAVVAAVISPISLLAWLMFFMAFFVGGRPIVGTPASFPEPIGMHARHSVGVAGIVFLGLPVMAAAGILTTVLGLIAISQIRSSRGRLTGMPLAVTTALLYPLILLMFLITIGTGHAARLFARADMSMPELQNLVSAAACLGILIAITAAVITYRGVWRWATRPPQPGEFT